LAFGVRRSAFVLVLVLVLDSGFRAELRPAAAGLEVLSGRPETTAICLSFLTGNE
jgi:hypothetical protein